MTDRTKRVVWLAATACFTLFAVLAGSALWRASSALDLSRSAELRSGEMAFERRRLDLAPGPFEEIPVQPVFRDLAEFSGDVWLAGLRGVYRYSPAGQLKRLYRTGYELPPAPPVRLRTGLDPLSSRPALFAALAGEGLLLFFEDGAVEQVRADDPAARDLTDLLPAETGRILLGTQQRGVIVYGGTRLSDLHPALSSGFVTALAGSEADLWAGTLESGLRHWRAGTFTEIGEDDGLPDSRILSLTSADRAVYAGTPVGVAELIDGRLARTLADGFMAQTLLVHDGDLWVGTLDEGLARIRLDLSRQSGSALGLYAEPRRVERLVERGGAVSAVAPHGVFPLPGGERALIPPKTGLTDSNISALRVDSSGRLWVGYFDRGLDLLSPQGDLLAHVEDDTVFCVNRIVERADHSGMFAATANGLVSIDRAGRKRETLRMADGLIADHVTDIVVGETGFSVSTPAGLTLFGPGGARSLNAFHGLVNNHVYTLGARGGTLLAGALGGLSVLENGRVTRSYSTANSELRHHWITAIADFRGEWFIATYGAGVARLDSGGRIRSWPEMEGVEINPNAIAAGDNIVVAGALDRGLLVYDPGMDHWRLISRGLPSVNVTALEIAAGIVYVGTENGLTRISEQTLSMQ